MFGFSVALRERRHIGVDLLYSMVGARLKHGMDLLANYTDIPEWILQMIIPLGFLLFALQLAINLFGVIRGHEPIHEEVAGV